MSLVKPSSHCPVCKHSIAWYDNIPIFAWFALRGRCRHCRGAFSFRYPLLELFTALLFVGLYVVYFMIGTRREMPVFLRGGWLVFTGHIILLCVLLASSLIDGEHWIIPLSVCYLAAGVGLLLSAIYPYFLSLEDNTLRHLVPYASGRSGAAALGALPGLGVSLLMLKFGIIKRSFEQWEQDEAGLSPSEETAPGAKSDQKESPSEKTPENVGAVENVRPEIIRELGFLAPILAGGLLSLWLLTGTGLNSWWEEIILTQKWLTGLLGSIFGFMIGGAVVWATRVLGSLAFGREAMGLGDVHLMAAVGAVLGWASPLIAFFVAPFFGLGWALTRLVLHRHREIPYGPFLSMGTVLVMIFYNVFIDYFANAFMPPQLNL